MLEERESSVMPLTDRDPAECAPWREARELGIVDAGAVAGVCGPCCVGAG